MKLIKLNNFEILDFELNQIKSKYKYLAFSYFNKLFIKIYFYKTLQEDEKENATVIFDIFTTAKNFKYMLSDFDTSDVSKNVYEKFFHEIDTSKVDFFESQKINVLLLDNKMNENYLKDKFGKCKVFSESDEMNQKKKLFVNKYFSRKISDFFISIENKRCRNDFFIILYLFIKGGYFINSKYIFLDDFLENFNGLDKNVCFINENELKETCFSFMFFKEKKNEHLGYIINELVFNFSLKYLNDWDFFLEKKFSTFIYTEKFETYENINNYITFNKDFHSQGNNYNSNINDNFFQHIFYEILHVDSKNDIKIFMKNNTASYQNYICDGGNDIIFVFCEIENNRKLNKEESESEGETKSETESIQKFEYLILCNNLVYEKVFEKTKDNYENHYFWVYKNKKSTSDLSQLEVPVTNYVKACEYIINTLYEKFSNKYAKLCLKFTEEVLWNPNFDKKNSGASTYKFMSDLIYDSCTPENFKSYFSYLYYMAKAQEHVKLNCYESIPYMINIIKFCREYDLFELANMYYEKATQMLEYNKENFDESTFNQYKKSLYYEYTIFSSYNGNKDISKEFVFICNYSKSYYQVTNLLSNLKFYKQILQNVNKIDVSESFNKFNQNFVSSTCSLIKVKDKYILNKRHVNYKYKDGNLIYCPNYITINKLEVYDKKFHKKKQHIFETEILNKKFNNNSFCNDGFEDIRLFKPISMNKSECLYYLASYADDNRLKIGIGKYLSSTNKLEINELKADFETSNVEKNWVYFPYLDENHIIYKWHPLTICSLDLHAHFVKKTIEINTPFYFSLMRGSSNGCLWNKDEKEYLFITHIVEYNTPRTYYHCFVLLNNRGKIIRYSAPYSFTGKSIEYNLGIELDFENNNLIVAFSVWDSQSHIQTFDRNYINSLMFFTI
jgi:hypothetical protein